MHHIRGVQLIRVQYAMVDAGGAAVMMGRSKEPSLMDTLLIPLTIIMAHILLSLRVAAPYVCLPSPLSPSLPLSLPLSLSLSLSYTHNFKRSNSERGRIVSDHIVLFNFFEL